MLKQFKAHLYIFGLLNIAVHAETIQLGGDIAVRTAGWLEMSEESGVSNVKPMSYTDSNGITFTVTATANTGQMVNVQNVGLAVVGGSNDARIEDSESLKITLSVSGGNLESLSASFLVGSLGKAEGFDFTDGSHTAVVAEPADNLIEYGTGKELEGLMPLSSSNVSTWSVNISVNANYAGTKGLLSALILDYTPAPPALFPIYGEADQLYRNHTTYDLNRESYSYSEIFRTETYSFPVFSKEHGTPLVSWNDSTFVVFADAGRRIKIAKITGDTVEEAYLDNIQYQANDFYVNVDNDPDNDIAGPDFYRMIEEDGHHDLCIGVDKDGYIHIAGDMHNFPDFVGTKSHLPMRYFNSHCLYWRSDNPGDISSFSFKGNDPSTCPQGYGFTYLQFYADLEGELFFTSRVFQGDPAKRIRRAQVTSRYDAENGSWSIIGGKAFEPNGYDVTFWEDNAENGGSYVKMFGDLSFDRQNKMHIASGILNYDADVVQTVWAVLTDLLYLQSDDGGMTMKKLDGSVVNMPARAEAGPNQAEIIYTTDYLSDPSNQEYLNASVQIAHDISNNPHVLCIPKVTDGLTILENGPAKLFAWDATSGWTAYDNMISDYQYFFTDPAGAMTVIEGNKVTRFWDTTSSRAITGEWKNVKAYDREYIKKTGNIQVLCEDTTTGELYIKRMEITRPGLELTTPWTEPVANHAPEITDQATITDNTLSVSATDAEGDPLTYTWSKSYGPGDITFTENGTTTSSNTTLSVNAPGSYEIKVAISDGTNTRASTVTAYLIPNIPDHPQIVAIGYLTIDFTSQVFESFENADDTYDRTGTVEVVDSGAGVRFTGDLWKAFPIHYQMTPNTIIEFDFSSSNEGELHAIGMTDTREMDFVTNPYEIIKLAGEDGAPYITERDGEYRGGTKHYTIPIGQLLTLNTELKNHLNFINADNSSETNPDAQSTFSNITIYEPTVDTDGDGQSNQTEIRLGTNPTNATSRFSITRATVRSDVGKINLSWPSKNGVQYRIWKSHDLVSWTIERDWSAALNPPEDSLDLDLSPTRTFYKIDAETQ